MRPVTRIPQVISAKGRQVQPFIQWLFSKLYTFKIFHNGFVFLHSFVHSVNSYLLTMQSVRGTRSRKKDRSLQGTRCPGQEIAKQWNNDSPEWEKHRLREAQSWNSHLVWVRIKEGREGPESYPEVAWKL